MPQASGQGILETISVTNTTPTWTTTGRTVEVIRSEISERLIKALFHPSMVCRPQFTGDLRSDVRNEYKRDSVCYIRRPLLWECQMLSNLRRPPFRSHKPFIVNTR